MKPQPPRSTLTDTLFPYTTLFRSVALKRLPAYARSLFLDGNADFYWFPVGTGLQSRVPMALCQRQARVNAGCKQPERIFEKIRRRRSEEHTSELQSLMRISYAGFCLKKKMRNNVTNNTNITC